MRPLERILWRGLSFVIFVALSFDGMTQHTVSARTLTSFKDRRSLNGHFVVENFLDETSNYEELESNSNDTQEASPLFYGFFFDGNASESINKISQLYFSSCLNRVSEFVDFMEANMKKREVKNVLDYFRKPLDPNTNRTDNIYHVTAKYCGRVDCSNYPDIAKPYIGKSFAMHIIGLFFTSRTFGLRLKLVEDQVYLFEEKSKTFPMQHINRKMKVEKGSEEMIFSSSYFEDTQSINEILNNEVIQEDNSISSSNNFPEVSFVPQEENFHPSDSKAHTTIGCAPNVEAVQTGFDLRQIDALEITDSIPHQDFHIQDLPVYTNMPSATLRRFGDEGKPLAYVIYPRDAMVIPAVFNHYF